MWKAPAMPPNAGSSARVALNEDGTVTVSVGGQEIGQGSFTIAAQMAAGALGVPYDWVRVTRPGGYRLQPLRVADRRQPPDLEHGQRRRGCRRGMPASRSWRWLPKPGMRIPKTWISSMGR